MEIEIIDLINKYNAKLLLENKKFKIYYSNYNNNNLYFGISGIGGKNINNFFIIFDNLNINIDFLISIGFAGATNEKLKVGNIVIPSNIFNKNNSKIFKIENKINLNNNINCLTVNKVYFKKDKIILKDKSNNIDFIDMESFYICENCEKRKIKFFIIRCISDDLLLELPNIKLISLYFNKNRKFDLYINLIKNFNEIIKFIKFHINIKKAKKSLYREVIKFISKYII